MSRVWIPGGRGMLGHDVEATCRSENLDVIVTGHELDIADADAVAAFVDAQRPTHIINCAAHTAVDRCESEGALAMRSNADGPRALGSVAHVRGIHVVHVSTDYVFSGDARAPYVEEDTTGPVSAYGRTKLAGEHALTQATQGAATIVRASWLFGLHGKSFPATMLTLMNDKPELRVVDDQTGRPTYTVDLARVLVALSQRRALGNWHFANEGALTWAAFATAILEDARTRGAKLACTRVVPIATREYPTPARRPAWSVLSTLKIERELAISPRPWRAALADFLDERLDEKMRTEAR